MAEKDDVLIALKDCDRRLRKLKAGQKLVHEAADAFRRLADQVDTTLEERRITPERRVAPRQTPDRRRLGGE